MSPPKAKGTLQGTCCKCGREKGSHDRNAGWWEMNPRGNWGSIHARQRLLCPECSPALLVSMDTLLEGPDPQSALRLVPRNLIEDVLFHADAGARYRSAMVLAGYVSRTPTVNFPEPPQVPRPKDPGPPERRLQAQQENVRVALLASLEALRFAGKCQCPHEQCEACMVYENAVTKAEAALLLIPPRPAPAPPEPGAAWGRWNGGDPF